MTGAAAFLISSGSLCLGMGSGPHPNVPYGIPPEVISPTDSERANETRLSDGMLMGVLLSVSYACVLVWRGRTKESRLN
jgi:hypothetical protein